MGYESEASAATRGWIKAQFGGLARDIEALDIVFYWKQRAEKAEAENAKLRAEGGWDKRNEELQQTIDDARQQLVRALDKFGLIAPDITHGIVALEYEIEDLRAVADAARRLSRNIGEFYELTDGVFLDVLDDALDALDKK